MVDAALLVEGGDRFGPRLLSSAGVDETHRDARVDGAERVRNHFAALVGFGDDPVCFRSMEQGDRGACPLDGGASDRAVVEDERVVVSYPGCDDPCLRRPCPRRGCRVDRNDDAGQFGIVGDAVQVEEVAGPQCAFYVVEDFGVEFLTADRGAFVQFQDLPQERPRQVRCVVVGGAAGDMAVGSVDEGFDAFDRPRCRGDDGTRVDADAEAEEQHVPRVRVPPRSQLVGPGEVVVRAA